MRTLLLLAILFCSGPVLAGSFDQIDCWSVLDSIAHAKVGVDTVALGGTVHSFAIYNASADTQINIAFSGVADDSIQANFFPVPKAAFSSMFISGIPGSYTLTTLYAYYADSTGVGDPIYIICWGKKD